MLIGIPDAAIGHVSVEARVGSMVFDGDIDMRRFPYKLAIVATLTLSLGTTSVAFAGGAIGAFVGIARAVATVREENGGGRLFRGRMYGNTRNVYPNRATPGTVVPGQAITANRPNAPTNTTINK